MSQGRWTPTKHLLLLSKKLVDVTAGRTTRLIVEMPPRHGKSQLCSRYFPAWYFGIKPQNNIILTSYEADFAASWGRMARDIIEKHGEELFDIRVRSDSSAANRWEIEGHGGGMITAGVGGAITGRGGNVLIVDDPIKNAEEAHSKLRRDKIWDWYKSTLYTRLEPGGAIIVIMTRWHEDDLVGRLLNPEYGEVEMWERVNFPAIATKDDILGRKPGEALWPNRYNIEELERIKGTVGSYWFESLYQQQPSPPEGSILKREWWKYYRQAPIHFDAVIQSWDCAFKDGPTSSYVVGQVWGKKGADKYLLDQVRARMDMPTTMAAIQTLSAKWPQAYAKYIEDKANGPAIIQMLTRQISGLIAVSPQGGKIVRAQAAAPDIEAGNVHLPDPSIAPWVHDFIEECAAFPNSANDDQVDSMTQAIHILRENPVLQSGGIRISNW